LIAGPIHRGALSLANARSNPVHDFCATAVGPVLALSTAESKAQVSAGSRFLLHKEAVMTVARITEISSISSKSFEDAVVQGVERANKTLRNVKGAWVKEQEVNIEN
jgi:flavin-binding protein dodecin